MIVRSTSLDSKLLGLAHLPPPVLTAYLDINPANPRNQGTPRGYVTWLKSTGQALAKDLPRDARKAFRVQLRRIESYLGTHRPRGRGLLVLALPTSSAIEVETNGARFSCFSHSALHQLVRDVPSYRPLKNDGQCHFIADPLRR